jgi:shikimate kinase
LTKPSVIKNIVILIGLPGSGKTTVGRQLAKRLFFRFSDSDAEVELHLGYSIREFFESNGEEAFRDIEQEMITHITADALETGTYVLSTGGGVVLRQVNRDALRLSGYVVYLRATPEDLFRRLRHDRNRPLLQVDDPLQRLRDLYTARDPLYRETAHFVIDTGRPSAAALVNMIVMQLELAGILPSGSGAAD